MLKLFQMTAKTPCHYLHQYGQVASLIQSTCIQERRKILSWNGLPVSCIKILLFCSSHAFRLFDLLASQYQYGKDNKHYNDLVPHKVKKQLYIYTYQCNSDQTIIYYLSVPWLMTSLFQCHHCELHIAVNFPLNCPSLSFAHKLTVKNIETKLVYK